MKRVAVFAFGLIIFMALTACGADDVDIADMLPALEKAKAGLSGALNAIDKDMLAAAQKLGGMGLKSTQARQVLAGLSAGRPYVYDCAIIDAGGKLSVIEPEAQRKYEGSDVSSQAHVKELLGNKTPVVSKVFRSIEGEDCIDFIYPIFNDKAEFIGALSMLVKQAQLLEGIIAPIVDDNPYKIWAMQTDGLVIYDQDADQINKNIFTDPMFKPFDDLVTFSGIVIKTQNGAGSYDFYKEGYTDKLLVKKDAVWDTVALHGRQWRIVIMEVERVLEEKK